MTQDYTLIVGIDQSLTNTAISLPNRRYLRVRETSSQPMHMRLRDWFLAIEDHLHAILAPTDERTLVVIEGYAFASKFYNHTTTEVGAALRIALAAYPCDVLICTPGALKKFITGDGKAKKNRIMMELLSKFRIKTADDNQADATVLRIIGHCFAGASGFNNIPFTKAQRAAIKDLQLWKVA